MKRPQRTTVQKVLDDADGTVLDLVDHVLTKGVVIDGEVVLGLAGIDLVYLKLAVLLCAADRVLPLPAAHRRKTAS